MNSTIHNTILSSTTISSKYQIVIPKEVRRRHNIKPGQRVYWSATKSGTLTMDTSSRFRKVYGSMRGAWGDDSTKYLTELRDEWEAQQDKLDATRRASST
jgi:AbrB family looped-hinge helix DNA binding protein